MPVSLRSAWLMSRACSPMWASPMSPSISALGVSAATESMTTRSTAPERVSISADLERLLAGVGLAHEKAFGVDADGARVGDVESVLGVDEGRHAAGLLRFGDGVQGERGLAARFGSVDFDDASARVAADAERVVERQRAAGDDGHRFGRVLFAQRHDGSFAELSSRCRP